MDLHSPEALARISLCLTKSLLHPEKKRPAPARVQKHRAGTVRSEYTRVLTRLLGLGPLLFIVFQAHGFYCFALPWYQLSTWPNLAAQTAFAAMVALLLSSYACTSLLAPGSPTWGANSKTGNWCERCLVQKPERCHHCSVCDRCVLKMDHHCIFTDSCIGLRNQPYFLLLVALATAASGCAAIAVTPQFLVSLRAALGFDGFDGSTFGLRLHLYVIILAVSAAVSFALLWDLLLGQLHGLLRNETTIEGLQNWEERRSSRYDRGAMKNVADVFGRWVQSFPTCVLCLDSLDQFLTND